MPLMLKVGKELEFGIGLEFPPTVSELTTQRLSFLGNLYVIWLGGDGPGVCTLTWIFFLSQVAEAHRRRAGSGGGEPHR